MPTVAMNSDARQCSEPEKNTVQNLGFLNLWGTVRQNSLNTPKSRCDAMADLQGAEPAPPSPSSQESWDRTNNKYILLYERRRR